MNIPAWIDAVVALLLVLSGIVVLLSAFGFLRLADFFVRMHPPAMAYTLGNWCVAAAGVVYFSALQGQPVLHPLLIPILLAITVPVTTTLLARVALFRQRVGKVAGTPPALSTAPPPSPDPPSAQA